ncbi:hypothetical protein ACULNC_19890 [Shigella flexneri]
MEIIGGSQREERLDVLDERMLEMGLNKKITGGIAICVATVLFRIQVSVLVLNA